MKKNVGNKSVCSDSHEYSENIWVVSLLNTVDDLSANLNLLQGHSAIYVEGIWLNYSCL